MPKSRVPIVLGAGGFGIPESGAHVSDPAVIQQYIDTLIAHGHVGIDTARLCGSGTSERIIGKLDLRGVARVDTKNFPTAPGDHAPERLKTTFAVSREALGGHKIRVFYLHAPDVSVPFEETLQAVDELHKAGQFVQFGVCNFSLAQLEDVLAICKRRGFIQPTVYQGPYNLIDRGAEAAILPLLRRTGMRLAAHSPLAGGYLTGKLLPASTDAADADTPAGTLTHFDPAWGPSAYYTTRYPPMGPALARLQAFVRARGLSLAGVAYRWLQWHSAMRPGDHGLVVGARNVEQLEATLAECEKGPLDDEVVKACEELWNSVKDLAKDGWTP